jgi:hypothetical protein
MLCDLWSRLLGLPPGPEEDAGDRSAGEAGGADQQAALDPRGHRRLQYMRRDRGAERVARASGVTDQVVRQPPGPGARQA